MVFGSTQSLMCLSLIDSVEEIVDIEILVYGAPSIEDKIFNICLALVIVTFSPLLFTPIFHFTLMFMYQHLAKRCLRMF